jgi:SpoVK/Ycf46/Vps4 family AAA+-type ATPase
VAILATNFRKNMDEAFVRRLQFTIDFPFPGPEERLRIWEGIWPNDMPRDNDVDIAALARRFEVTGGNIRNIALSSAFLAAADGAVVSSAHVTLAIQREYQKIGKLMSDKDLKLKVSS